MTKFEEAKARARELDRLHPTMRHFVGITYRIVRVMFEMNKPNTPLHDRNYPEDWKLWIKEHLKTQEYESKEQAMKGVMKETRGLINPNWIAEAWDEWL